MKKIIFLSLFVFSVSIINAQTAHFGIKGGLNASNLYFKGPGGSDYQYGFHAGLLAHIHASNTFAIQPEIYYSQQGGKRRIFNNDFRFNLNYINVPLLGQIMFGKGSRIEFGPQLGILVNANQKIDKTESKVTEAYKPTDFSLVAGYSYLGPKQLGFALRYNYGVSNINNLDNGVFISNNVAQFSLLYQFDHRGKR